jgi:hypothetical protein
MKTKILSKLMLMGFTAVMMVGCDTKKGSSTEGADATKTDAAETRDAAAPQPPDPCIVCDEKEDHRIKRSEFEDLIINFDKEFVSKGIFRNHGGVIVMENNSGNKSLAYLKSYATLKLHLGIEGTGSSKRLLVTYEPESASCIDDKYQGTLGINSNLKFLSSYAVNDIIIPKINKDMFPIDIESHFFKSNTFKITNDTRKEITKAATIKLWESFKTFDKDRNIYFCEDIMFNINKTLDEITSVSQRNAFQYYFGYDETKTLHKIRLILVGIDKEDKVVMFDATGDYLFRETSRPRP